MRHDRWRRGPLAGVSLLGLGLASWRPLRAAKSSVAPDPGSQVLFTPGPTGYKAYRIPVLVRIASGRLFAFCEARWGAGPSADSGHIDIVFRTSDDDGSTWSPARLATALGGGTASNPAPTFDPGTGHIVPLSTRNRSEDTFATITAGIGQPRRVYVQRCTDPDAPSPTFDTPTEITTEVQQGGAHTNPGWHWYATGPHVGAAITAGPPRRSPRRARQPHPPSGRIGVHRVRAGPASGLQRRSRLPGYLEDRGPVVDVGRGAERGRDCAMPAPGPSARTPACSDGARDPPGRPLVGPPDAGGPTRGRGAPRPSRRARPRGGADH